VSGAVTGSGVVAGHVSVAPLEVEQPDVREVTDVDKPWIVIVWNDPVNLMSYVVFVFQKLFGYSRAKATRLMHQVHEEGRAVVSDGLGRAESDAARLRGLWATMEHPADGAVDAGGGSTYDDRVARSRSWSAAVAA
jgi:ATP-dependent Clp protease adaptor protein ClpS